MRDIITIHFPGFVLWVERHPLVARFAFPVGMLALGGLYMAHDRPVETIFCALVALYSLRG